jgi:hypothetical protein
LDFLGGGLCLTPFNTPLAPTANQLHPLAKTGGNKMRLRQIALVAHDLEPHAADFKAVLGLNVAYRDPGVAVFGLVNVVMPVGGEFLEIVQPVKPDASAARYLKRRSGDAGYMVILQDDDALAHRARLEAVLAANIPSPIFIPAISTACSPPSIVSAALTISMPPRAIGHLPGPTGKTRAPMPMC